MYRPIRQTVCVAQLIVECFSCESKIICIIDCRKLNSMDFPVDVFFYFFELIISAQYIRVAVPSLGRTDGYQCVPQCCMFTYSYRIQ